MGTEPRSSTPRQHAGAIFELDARWWRLTPERRASFRFFHASTDEVFVSLGTSGLFSEQTGHAPNSPYSASKASPDHLVRAWRETYELPTMVTNCSNNYGSYHFPEKLIPHIIITDWQPLPFYTDDSNVGDWHHVADHTEALTLVLKCGSGQILARNAVPHRGLIDFVADRHGHDLRYAMDPGKIERELGWRPRETFESGLAKTVRWFFCDSRRGYRHTRIGLVRRNFRGYTERHAPISSR
ncbi:dTDP-D-glucose 4,6-dehydratase [Bradyrhizobium sp. S3.2.12]